MTTPNSYLDDFMDKMVTVPNDVNRLLSINGRFLLDDGGFLYPHCKKENWGKTNAFSQ